MEAQSSISIPPVSWLMERVRYSRGLDLSGGQRAVQGMDPGDHRAGDEGPGE